MAILESKRGSGGTNMLKAIQKAMANPKDEGMSRSFVIITDGKITVEKEAFDYIKNNLGKANFFAFGMGKSVNRHLIEGIARVGYGEPFIITKESEGKAKAEKFQQYIQSPVLTDIKLTFDGIDAYDISPENIPDLMGERPIVVFGKYDQMDKAIINVYGNTPQGKYQKQIKFKSVKENPTNPALKYLWARHKIKGLSDYTILRSGDNDQIIKEITQLGLDYNLLTDYTSFIAIDSEIRNKEGQQNKIYQPLPTPEECCHNDNVSYSTTLWCFLKTSTLKFF